MSLAQAHSGVRLLPIRPIRAGVLSFLTALAFIEVGAGVVVAEAWKLHRDHAVLSVDDVWQLHQLLERLRVMEVVVAGGAVATTVLWSFVAVSNASHVARNSGRTAILTVVAWLAAPVAVVALGSFEQVDRSLQVSVVLLMAQAIVMYLPFGMIAKASSKVGGPGMPFLRWYLAVALAFAVHHVFTGSLDLAAPTPGDDLGRTAMLYLVNGVVVGVIVVMAAEATRSMQKATKERASQHDLLQADAHQRVRSTSTTGEQEVTSASMSAVLALPAEASTGPAGEPLTAPPTAVMPVAVAPTPFAAPTLLATPPSVPITPQS